MGRRLKTMLAGGVVGLGALTALSYATDYAIFRLRLAKGWNTYGSVTVEHYSAVAQKNGKTEFIFDPPGPATCVRTLFPHEGYAPCWYLSRHPERRTDI
jgi:hypothetical protein